MGRDSRCTKRQVMRVEKSYVAKPHIIIIIISRYLIYRFKARMGSKSLSLKDLTTAIKSDAYKRFMHV